MDEAIRPRVSGRLRVGGDSDHSGDMQEHGSGMTGVAVLLLHAPLSGEI